MGVIKRQGIKNLFIAYTGVVIGAISAILLQPVFLSTTELGFTRNLYNFSFMLSIVLPLGLPNIILRFYPQYKEDDAIKKYFFGFILLYFSISAIIISSIFFLFKDSISSLYKKDSELFINYFLCVIPYALIITLNSIITAFSQAAYKSTVPSFLNDIVSRLLVILVTVMYHYRWISFDMYVLFYLLIYCLVIAILIIYLKKFDLISFRINLPVLNKIHYKKIIPYGLILLGISFASFCLRNLDSIFLGTYSLSNVAIYSTAVYLAMFIEVPLSSLERISYSKIAENFANKNFVEMNKIYFDSVKYLMIFGGYIFLGINACSKYIYEFLPSEYSESLYLISILSFGCLVNVMTGVNNAILYYTSHFKLGAILLAFAFIFTLGLDLLFIPLYGMLAAACVTAAVAVLYNVAKFWLIYKIFKFQPYNINSLKILLLIAVGFIIVVFLPSFTSIAVLNILINGSIISVFYIFCVYKLNVIPEIFDTIKAKFAKRS